jgi:hypothetical protein
MALFRHPATYCCALPEAHRLPSQARPNLFAGD